MGGDSSSAAQPARQISCFDSSAHQYRDICMCIFFPRRAPDSSRKHDNEKHITEVTKADTRMLPST